MNTYKVEKWVDIYHCNDPVLLYDEYIDITSMKDEFGYLNFGKGTKYNIKMYEKNDDIYIPIKINDRYYLVKTENGVPVIDMDIKKHRGLLVHTILNNTIRATYNSDDDLVWPCGNEKEENVCVQESYLLDN